MNTTLPALRTWIFSLPTTAAARLLMLYYLATGLSIGPLKLKMSVVGEILGMSVSTVRRANGQLVDIGLIRVVRILGGTLILPGEQFEERVACKA